MFGSVFCHELWPRYYSWTRVGLALTRFLQGVLKKLDPFSKQLDSCWTGADPVFAGKLLNPIASAKEVGLVLDSP